MDALIQEQKEMDTLEKLSRVQSPKEIPLAASLQQLTHPIQPTWFKEKSIACLLLYAQDAIKNKDHQLLETLLRMQLKKCEKHI